MFGPPLPMSSPQERSELQKFYLSVNRKILILILTLIWIAILIIIQA